MNFFSFRNFLIFLVLSLFLLNFTFAADYNISGCQVLSPGNSYDLNSDISGWSDSCFSLDSSNSSATIDLNCAGHSITSQGTSGSFFDLNGALDKLNLIDCKINVNSDGLSVVKVNADLSDLNVDADLNLFTGDNVAVFDINSDNASSTLNLNLEDLNVITGDSNFSMIKVSYTSSSNLTTLNVNDLNMTSTSKNNSYFINDLSNNSTKTYNLNNVYLDLNNFNNFIYVSLQTSPFTLNGNSNSTVILKDFAASPILFANSSNVIIENLDLNYDNDATNNYLMYVSNDTNVSFLNSTVYKNNKSDIGLFDVSGNNFDFNFANSVFYLEAGSFMTLRDVDNSLTVYDLNITNKNDGIVFEVLSDSDLDTLNVFNSYIYATYDNLSSTGQPVYSYTFDIDTDLDLNLNNTYIKVDFSGATGGLGIYLKDLNEINIYDLNISLNNPYGFAVGTLYVGGPYDFNYVNIYDSVFTVSSGTVLGIVMNNESDVYFDFNNSDIYLNSNSSYALQIYSSTYNNVTLEGLSFSNNSSGSVVNITTYTGQSASYISGDLNVEILDGNFTNTLFDIDDNVANFYLYDSNFSYAGLLLDINGDAAGSATIFNNRLVDLNTNNDDVNNNNSSNFSIDFNIQKTDDAARRSLIIQDNATYIGGNLWLDASGNNLACSNPGTDGICDSPYTVSGVNNDYNDYLPIAEYTYPTTSGCTDLNSDYNSNTLYISSDFTATGSCFPLTEDVSGLIDIDCNYHTISFADNAILFNTNGHTLGRIRFKNCDLNVVANNAKVFYLDKDLASHTVELFDSNILVENQGNRIFDLSNLSASGYDLNMFGSDLNFFSGNSTSNRHNLVYVNDSNINDLNLVGIDYLRPLHYTFAVYLNGTADVNAINFIDFDDFNLANQSSLIILDNNDPNNLELNFNDANAYFYGSTYAVYNGSDFTLDKLYINDLNVEYFAGDNFIQLGQGTLNELYLNIPGFTVSEGTLISLSLNNNDINIYGYMQEFTINNDDACYLNSSNVSNIHLKDFNVLVQNGVFYNSFATNLTLDLNDVNVTLQNSSKLFYFTANTDYHINNFTVSNSNNVYSFSSGTYGFYVEKDNGTPNFANVNFQAMNLSSAPNTFVYIEDANVVSMTFGFPNGYNNSNGTFIDVNGFSGTDLNLELNGTSYTLDKLMVLRRDSNLETLNVKTSAGIRPTVDNRLIEINGFSSDDLNIFFNDMNFNLTGGLLDILNTNINILGIYDLNLGTVTTSQDVMLIGSNGIVDLNYLYLSFIGNTVFNLDQYTKFIEIQSLTNNNFTIDFMNNNINVNWTNSPDYGLVDLSSNLNIFTLRDANFYNVTSNIGTNNSAANILYIDGTDVNYLRIWNSNFNLNGSETYLFTLNYLRDDFLSLDFNNSSFSVSRDNVKFIRFTGDNGKYISSLEINNLNLDANMDLLSQCNLITYSLTDLNSITLSDSNINLMGSDFFNFTNYSASDTNLSISLENTTVNGSLKLSNIPLTKLNNNTFLSLENSNVSVVDLTFNNDFNANLSRLIYLKNMNGNDLNVNFNNSKIFTSNLINDLIYGYRINYNNLFINDFNVHNYNGSSIVYINGNYSDVNNIVLNNSNILLENHTKLLYLREINMNNISLTLNNTSFSTNNVGNLDMIYLEQYYDTNVISFNASNNLDLNGVNLLYISHVINNSSDDSLQLNLNNTYLNLNSNGSIVRSDANIGNLIIHDINTNIVSGSVLFVNTTGVDLNRINIDGLITLNNSKLINFNNYRDEGIDFNFAHTTLDLNNANLIYFQDSELNTVEVHDLNLNTLDNNIPNNGLFSFNDTNLSNFNLDFVGTTDINSLAGTFIYFNDLNESSLNLNFYNDQIRITNTNSGIAFFKYTNTNNNYSLNSLIVRDLNLDVTKADVIFDLNAKVSIVDLNLNNNVHLGQNDLIKLNNSDSNVTVEFNNKTLNINGGKAVRVEGSSLNNLTVKDGTFSLNSALVSVKSTDLNKVYLRDLTITGNGDAVYYETTNNNLQIDVNNVDANNFKVNVSNLNLDVNLSGNSYLKIANSDINKITFKDFNRAIFKDTKLLEETDLDQTTLDLNFANSDFNVIINDNYRFIKLGNNLTTLNVYDLNVYYNNLSTINTALFEIDNNLQTLNFSNMADLNFIQSGGLVYLTGTNNNDLTINLNNTNINYTIDTQGKIINAYDYYVNKLVINDLNVFCNFNGSIISVFGNINELDYNTNNVTTLLKGDFINIYNDTSSGTSDINKINLYNSDFNLGTNSWFISSSGDGKSNMDDLNIYDLNIIAFSSSNGLLNLDLNHDVNIYLYLTEPFTFNGSGNLFNIDANNANNINLYINKKVTFNDGTLLDVKGNIGTVKIYDLNLDFSNYNYRLISVDENTSDLNYLKVYFLNDTLEMPQGTLVYFNGYHDSSLNIDFNQANKDFNVERMFEFYQSDVNNLTLSNYDVKDCNVFLEVNDSNIRDLNVYDNNIRFTYLFEVHSLLTATVWNNYFIDENTDLNNLLIDSSDVNDVNIDFNIQKTDSNGNNIVGKSYKGGNYWTDTDGNSPCTDTTGDYICESAKTVSINGTKTYYDYLPLTLASSYTAPSSNNSPSGGSGPSGGSSSATELTPENPISKKSLRKGRAFSFKVGGESHKITVKDINYQEKKAKIIVESEPQEFWLKEGETVKADLNNDNIYDISITLVEIVSADYAKFDLNAIQEAIYPETETPTEEIEVPETQPETEQPPVEEETKEEEQPKTAKKVVQKTPLWKYIVFVVVLLLAIALVVYIIWKNKGHKKGL